MSQAAPTLAELDQVLNQIIKRFTKYLERQKIIIRDPTYALDAS